MGFFPTWDFFLMGFFPTWDFVLMGFYPDTEMTCSVKDMILHVNVTPEFREKVLTLNLTTTK